MESEVTPPSGSPARLDLVVVGHTNLDHFLRVPELPARDRTVPVLSQHTELGGTAANIARAAARWGVAVGLVSRVGEDFPSEFTETLASERIDLTGFSVVPDTRSPACYIVEDGREAQVTLIHQGPMGKAGNALVPTDLIGRADWVHLTTGDPEFLERIANAARKAGVKVALDPAQEIHYLWNAERLQRMLEKAEILFGNTAEVGRAVQMLRLPNTASLLDHVPLIVETQGRRGAVAYSRRGNERVAAAPLRRAHQVTGAGDAFRGGFYAGWFAGEPLERCLRAGTRSSSRWMGEGPGGRTGPRGGGTLR